MRRRRPCSSYFPSDFLLFIDESHVTVPQIGGMYRGDRSRKETLVEYGFRLPSALDNRPLNFEEFDACLNQTIYVSATPAQYELGVSRGAVVEQLIRPTGLMDPVIIVRPARSQVDDLLDEIRKRVECKERVLVTTLTKRMAEDLTEYYQDLNVKVRYLHSDIEDHRTCRNYSPAAHGAVRCSGRYQLAARRARLAGGIVGGDPRRRQGRISALGPLAIQTIGRAARNVNGTVILYADSMTESMKRAMDETERRRRLQRAFNEKHGITPQSIVKALGSPLIKIYDADYLDLPVAAEKPANYRASELPRVIRKLQKEMRQAAERLEFEKAAELRDRIRTLETQDLALRDAGLDRSAESQLQ